MKRLRPVLTATLVFAALVIIAPTASAQMLFTLEGTMVHTSIEGGCWYLDASGKHYEIIGDAALLAQIEIEGKYVKLLVQSAKGTMSTCMVGEPVKLESIVDTQLHAFDPMVLDQWITGTMHRTRSGTWYVRTAKGSRYSLQHVEKQYRRIGAKYSRNSRVVILQRSEGYTGTIVGDAAIKERPAPPVHHDPR